MDFQDRLARLRAEVPGCIAAFTIRLHEGTVAAIAGGEGLGHGSPDAVAAVVRDLFARSDAAAAGHEQREIIVLSDERAYVCRRLAARPDLALAAVCEHASNLGLMLAIARREMALLESER